MKKSTDGKSRNKATGSVTVVVPAVSREGITKQVANQIVGLQQHGLRVSLIVLAKSDVQVLGEYGIMVDELPVLQLNRTSSYLSVNAFFSSLSTVRPIDSFLKKQETSSVVAHAPYAHFVMRLVKLLHTRQKFVLVQYFHGLQYSEYPVNTWRRRMVNKLNQWLGKQFDDSHVSVSEAVKQEISTNLFRHQNHQVIYNSLPVHAPWDEKADQVWQQVQQQLQLAGKKFKILLPNRIDYNKGQLFFLNVLKKFLQKDATRVAEVAVIIAGDGPQRYEVEQLVRKEQLTSVVTLTGALPNTVVQQLLQQVQLVVIPSFREGMPFVVLEALAAKCVVLASRAGGIQEVIRHQETGFLFKTGDEKDCFEKLEYLYQNRKELQVNFQLIEDDLENRFSMVKQIHLLLKALAI